METRFRAYQLDSEGSLFSHYKPGVFTLIEARTPKAGIEDITKELAIFSKTKIDCLHITSWDIDHCKYDDLIQILNKFRPSLIEIPFYDPETDEGKLCKNTIEGYELVHERYKPNVRKISKDYISTLEPGTPQGVNNIVYSPDFDAAKSNDKSSIKLFRSMGCNVVSLGDIESPVIAESLLKCSIFSFEIDVLILPHHGADNGFITGPFLDKIKPKIAICSSNHGNQYGHPKENIRSLLSNRSIPLLTTKEGDIIIEHAKGSTQTSAWNFVTNNTGLQGTHKFVSKRYLIN
jgi:competence protein ComEC